MLFILIGCLMVKDPSVSPEIEDFYMESDFTDDNPTEHPEPVPSSAELTLIVEDGILSVEHANVLLPCEVDIEPVSNIDNFVLTIVYTEEVNPECEESVYLTYSINLQDEQAGSYTFIAQGTEAEFELE
jgi:hypothetical protein